MLAPVPMLSGPGGAKAAVVLAILIGLYVVTTMQKTGQAPANSPR